MAEEHGFQEGHRLCANNCGFFGSPATLNLCSKCYRDFHMKEEQASSAKSAVEKSLSTPSSSSTVPAPLSPPVIALPETAGEVRAPAIESASLPAPVAAQANRCLACRKRVGLTGFRCRCGSTFCGSHRYPEQHECEFDFKKVGKEAIARDNPVVKAAKLNKI